MPLYSGLMCIFPLVFLAIPFMGTFARVMIKDNNASSSSWAVQLVWGSMVVNLMFARVGGMAFS